jgi:hypothetical protein
MAYPLSSVNFAGRVRRFALVLLDENGVSVLPHHPNHRARGKRGARQGVVASIRLSVPAPKTIQSALNRTAQREQERAPRLAARRVALRMTVA